MTQTARILATQTQVFQGRRSLTFEWEGPRSATVRIDGTHIWEALKKESPWPLRVVEYNMEHDRYTIARVDGAARVMWLWYVARAWLKNRTALTKARLIMTLMVWNLAYVPNGTVPDWCHIGRKGCR